MSSPVNITILGKEYQISCPEEEKESLISSARLVHDNMEKIRSTGKVVGLDRIAVMAALNLAHELIKVKKNKGDGNENVTESISRMQAKINEYLDEDRQLDL